METLMLIISKFHDYYDSAIAYGVDKTCVYERTTKIIEENKWVNPYAEFNNKTSGFHLTKHTIGFAGNIYRCVKVIERNRYTHKNQELCFYKAETLIEYMKEHGIGLKQKGFSQWGNIYKSEANVRDYFDKEIKQKIYDVFREYHVPIFIINSDKIILNPSLKEFKFGKIKDSVTAFQEIHQYLAGVLGNKEKDTIDIPDKIRVQQHGFNDWSFKKLPGQKKRGKK